MSPCVSVAVIVGVSERMYVSMGMSVTVTLTADTILSAGVSVGVIVGAIEAVGEDVSLRTGVSTHLILAVKITASTGLRSAVVFRVTACMSVDQLVGKTVRIVAYVYNVVSGNVRVRVSVGQIYG